VVANIRRGYQQCLTAYQARRTYDANKSRYTDSLKAWEKTHHTKKAQPVKVNGKTVNPPAPPASIKGPRPTIPADCPGPAAAAGGGG
jgi:hypothetical protein